MPRSREEQETVIRFSEASPTASLWTASSRVAERWRRRGIEVVERQGSWWAEVPKTRVRVMKPVIRLANGGSFRRAGVQGHADAFGGAAGR
jgi:hypothetical protein